MFGTVAYMFVEPRCRIHRHSDVAERCYHLCNGAFNYFVHPGVDVPRANVLRRINGQVVLSGKTVYPYLKLSDDLAVNDAMFNEGGVSAYNPVSLDDNMFPSLPLQDPSREHVITDSVPVTVRPAEAPSIPRHPAVPPPTREQIDPVSRPVAMDRQAAVDPASPARPRPPSGASTPGDRVVAPEVPAPNTTDSPGGASARPVALGDSAAPTRIANIPQDYVLHPGDLRGQDYGITFLRSSKTGQRNEAKYAKCSKAATTRQYFALGGSAANWRYDLQHRYVRFADAGPQQRMNSLLELRTLSDDSLVEVFLNLDADGVPLSSPSLDTPVSGGDKPSWSQIASQALHHIYYFKPEQVAAKLNGWLVDPSVHDYFYKKRAREF